MSKDTYFSGFGEAQGGVDACLILEGSYPYVVGGVSGWTQQLILDHQDLSFGVAAIRPTGEVRQWRYDRPGNLDDFQIVSLGAECRRRWRLSEKEQRILAGLLVELATEGQLETVRRLLAFLEKRPGPIDAGALLEGPAAWAVVREMYEILTPGASFLQFFWAWRAFFGGVLQVLLAPLPEARVYHAISTGYAGLMAARAAVETGRPAILTEHGIYTNERRIDLMLATWVHDSFPAPLAMANAARQGDIRDFWIVAFESLARICYEASSEIISLSETGRKEQIAVGADPRKAKVIPNGIDPERFAITERKSDAPCIALVGRVVAIKDVISYLRATALVAAQFPNLKALVVGPEDEEPEYAARCHAMCSELGLDDVVEFTGMKPIAEVLGKIDLMVLTSTSESMPLVLLEAGAAGVACVATNTGACRDIIEGSPNEAPLGPGGRISKLSAPEDTAAKITELLADDQLRKSCATALKSRVSKYYRANMVQEAYRDLYARMLSTPELLQWRA